MSNTSISNSTIIEQLNWRYAVKTYDSTKKVSRDDWAMIEESLNLAPSSYGIQPYKFLIIEDPALREKLRVAAWGQSQITDASHLVVIAYKKTLSDEDIEHFVERIAEVRSVPKDSLIDYENVMKGSAQKAVDNGYIETWNSRQAYIALGFLLETAALIGVDATPMEGFDPDQFNEILGLTDYSALVVAAVGYRDADNDWLAPLKKVRKPVDEIIERI